MMREACGVYAVSDSTGGSVFPNIYWGLLAQNHRGHHSYGFLTYKNGLHVHKDLGLIPPVNEPDFSKWEVRMPGSRGLGHVRYATSGLSDTESLIRDMQPLTEKLGGDSLSLAFNGNIVNVHALSTRYASPLDLQKGSDTVLVARSLLTTLQQEGDLVSAVRHCMTEVEGAFSIAGMTKEGDIFAFRDPYGLRPLCAGVDDSVTGISSESVGLDINGIGNYSEVKPGELLTVDGEGSQKTQVCQCSRRAFCAFEYAYFARPDSMLDSRYVYLVRNDFGANLGDRYSEISRRLDVVLSIPETADDAAYGFHQETGVPWDRALRRHRYVTQRAFISKQEERASIIARKVNMLQNRVSGKKVGVVDDSIVRGDTTRTNVKRLRAAGASEVHLFITFPRITGPCFYGVDMATYGELIGARLEAEAIARELGADSVNYQPLDAFVRACGVPREDLCLGCITGDYPTPLARRMASDMKARFDRGENESGRIYEVLK